MELVPKLVNITESHDRLHLTFVSWADFAAEDGGKMILPKIRYLPTIHNALRLRTTSTFSQPC